MAVSSFLISAVVGGDERPRKSIKTKFVYSGKRQVAATLNSNNNDNDEKDSHFSNFNRNRPFLEQLRGELVQDFTAIGKVFCYLNKMHI